MKRDMDLVRKILFTVEERPENANQDISIDGCSEDNLRLHLRLMEEAGLLNKVSFSSSGGSVDRLTWQGYEFLDSARNETIWNKAKDIVIEKTGGLALSAISEVLKTMFKSFVEGGTPFA